MLKEAMSSLIEKTDISQCVVMSKGQFFNPSSL